MVPGNTPAECDTQPPLRWLKVCKTQADGAAMVPGNTPAECDTQPPLRWLKVCKTQADGSVQSFGVAIGYRLLKVVQWLKVVSVIGDGGWWFVGGGDGGGGY